MRNKANPAHGPKPPAKGRPQCTAYGGRSLPWGFLWQLAGSGLLSPPVLMCDPRRKISARHVLKYCKPTIVCGDERVVENPAYAQPAVAFQLCQRPCCAGVGHLVARARHHRRSAGNTGLRDRSIVLCTRANVPLSALASSFAARVLANPGGPSISRRPPVSTPISSRSISPVSSQRLRSAIWSKRSCDFASSTGAFPFGPPCRGGALRGGFTCVRCSQPSA